MAVETGSGLVYLGLSIRLQIRGTILLNTTQPLSLVSMPNTGGNPNLKFLTAKFPGRGHSFYMPVVPSALYRLSKCWARL